MKRVSVEQIMAWCPCGWDSPDDGKNYTEARVKKLFGRRKYMTALQMTFLDIPPEDILWVALRPELLGERLLRIVGCDYAERALLREREAGREPDPGSWQGIEVSRRFADGKATREELEAARAEAAEAARAEAAEATRAAAWAAWAASAASAASAARAARVAEAASAAASAASAARAARAAERKWQVEHLREVLEKEKL